QRHGAAAQLLLELAQQRFDRVGAWVHAGHSSRNFDIVNVPVVMRGLESRQTALPEPPMRLAHALPLALALTMFATAGAALAADETPPQTPQQLLDASAPSDWRTPDADDLLYMEIPGGR